ncbi:hypothetical protein [Ekhidna sp. To15]|uniref:hypothetical protein n=1 Tax=Ekhidna sp. To15 TaxID=3395267 RepID=UPI003F526062
MKALKNAPTHYVGSDAESIASVLNVGYLLLPVFLTVVLIRQLVQDDIDLSIVIGISLVFSFFARSQFLKGYLKQSIASVVIFFNILLTIACSLGNGINDIGIIGFPIIIGFSGIILDQKKLAIASILSITAVLWLVIGEYLNIYTPVTKPVGSAGDFLVSALLIILGGIVAFSLTRNMKISLKDAQREIFASKKDAENLSEETNKKLEIIEEIHRTVINSLNHIRQLIDNKQQDISELEPVYESLKRKVLVIEVAHNILLSAKTPIMLDIRNLTSKLINKYEKNLKTPILRIDTGSVSHFVPLDLAINYGICLIELVNDADTEGNETISVTLIVNKETIDLKISGFEGNHSAKPGIVIDLLTKQLQGTLSKSSTEFLLSFKHTPN